MDGTDVDPDLTALGWDEHADAGWRAAGSPGRPGRVSRLDRGWSTVLYAPDRAVRVRNIGADVAAKLSKAGFERVYLLDGGIAAWQQAGLPLVKGRA